MHSQMFVRIGVVLACLIWSCVSLAGSREEYRDTNNRLLGHVTSQADGKAEARSSSNRLLGIYDPSRNETRRANGTLMGRGNMLAVLIYEDARAQGLVSNGRPLSDIAEQKHRERIERLETEGNRPIVLPEVAARQARMGLYVTQEDRRRTIDAYQLAGEDRGREYFWSNPATGNAGSILLFADQKFNDTYMHGKLVPCYRGRMLLHAGGETDEQRQVICKLPHNGVWTTVQTELD
ncbi:MAG: hypothetical protein ACK4FK_05735 [Ferrovibrio sp.]|uniref:hypothetical protein n=1 Tax=Ferrovibrio sp. TaxID=1917215 RepID=UPI00391AB477